MLDDWHAGIEKATGPVMKGDFVRLASGAESILVKTGRAFDRGDALACLGHSKGDDILLESG